MMARCLIVFTMVAILHGACSAAQSDVASRVSFYAAAGGVVQSWENPEMDSLNWVSDLVGIKVGGKKVILSGTIVIEWKHRHVGGQKGSFTVTLDASSGRTIRTWKAKQINPAWESGRLDLIDAETQKAFTIFGTFSVVED